MSDGVRIKLSAGLLVVALLHALTIVGMFEVLHQPARCGGHRQEWKLPALCKEEPPVGKLAEPPHVNLQAQGEIKQQCVDCGPTIVRPGVRIVRPAPVVIQPAPAPALQPQPAPVLPASQSNLILRPASTPVTPPVKEYQLALFIGNDAKSQQLLDWFNRDPRLQSMRTSCEFQVYTTGNPLYQARFAQQIPAEQFPVVLLQDKSGGHIHAAGRSMIPSTVDALYADFHKSYELYKQARQAQKTGAIKSRGYSWDAAITPAMQLQPGDCPDGFCPNDSSDRWTPGSRIRNPLFDEVRDTRDAILWASAPEIATVVLVIVAVLLLGVIVWRRTSL